MRRLGAERSKKEIWALMVVRANLSIGLPGDALHAVLVNADLRLKLGSEIFPLYIGWPNSRIDLIYSFYLSKSLYVHETRLVG